MFLQIGGGRVVYRAGGRIIIIMMVVAMYRLVSWGRGRTVAAEKQQCNDPGCRYDANATEYWYPGIDGYKGRAQGNGNHL